MKVVKILSLSLGKKLKIMGPEFIHLFMKNTSKEVHGILLSHTAIYDQSAE